MTEHFHNSCTIFIYNSYAYSNFLQNVAKDMSRLFSKDKIHMANRHMKECSSSLAIKDIKQKRKRQKQANKQQTHNDV